MLNQTGITKTTGINVKQILFNTELFAAVGIIVDDANVSTNAEGKKIVYAGTPLYGDIADRNSVTSFTFETTPSSLVKAVYQIQIATAFANDEVITIGGVDYTKKATESVGDLQFGGATAALQVVSLLKMVAYAGFDITGSTDKLIFTVAEYYENHIPTVTKTSVTGALGTLTNTVQEVSVMASNAVGILLHDVDCTNGDTNGTLLVFGFVDLNKLDTATAARITAPVIKALAGKVTFLK